MIVLVNSLTHHPRNAEIYNLDDIDDLVASIEEVGLLTPLVIDQDNQVISGNRRFKAILELGWDTVEVQRVEVSPDEVDRLIVHHNKQRTKTHRELLNEYHALTKVHKNQSGKRTDLQKGAKPINRRNQLAEQMGVSATRLARLLVVEKRRPDLIERMDNGTITLNAAYTYLQKQDRIESSLRQKIKPPANFNNEKFTFHQKSSERMTELEDGTVQTIFTSPPYWNLRSYDDNPNALGREDDHLTYVSKLLAHLEDCWRVLKDEGSFFLNLGDTRNKNDLLNIPHRVCLGLQDRGWMLRNTIIWKKTNPGLGGLGRSLTRSYEFIFHLVKSNQYFYYETLRARKTPYGSGFYTARYPDGSIDLPRFAVDKDGASMTDYWDEDVVKTTVANQASRKMLVDHPAPFHENIVKLPILQTSREYDLVLDPFCGVGTVGKVANEMNRRFVGYDIKHYGDAVMVGD